MNAYAYLLSILAGSGAYYVFIDQESVVGKLALLMGLISLCAIVSMSVTFVIAGL